MIIIDLDGRRATRENMKWKISCFPNFWVWPDQIKL